MKMKTEEYKRLKKIHWEATKENYANLLKGVWNSFCPTAWIMPRSITAHLRVVDEIHKILGDHKKWEGSDK